MLQTLAREYVVECMRLLLMWSFYIMQAHDRNINVTSSSYEAIKADDITSYDAIKAANENKFANIYAAMMSKVANRQLVELSLVREKFTEKDMEVTIGNCFGFIPYGCSEFEQYQGPYQGKIEFVKFIFGLGNFIFTMQEGFYHFLALANESSSPFRLLYEFIKDDVEITYWALEPDPYGSLYERHPSINKNSFLHWPDLDSIPEAIKQQMCKINSNLLKRQQQQLQTPIEITAHRAHIRLKKRQLRVRAKTPAPETSTQIEDQQLETQVKTPASETSIQIESTNSKSLQIFLTCVIAFLGVGAASYLLLGNFLFDKILPFCGITNYIFTGIIGALSIFLITTSIIRACYLYKYSPNGIVNRNCCSRFFKPLEQPEQLEQLDQPAEKRSQHNEGAVAP